MPGRPVADPAQVEQALRLLARGVSLRETGRQVGVSPNAVQRWGRLYAAELEWLKSQEAAPSSAPDAPPAAAVPERAERIRRRLKLPSPGAVAAGSASAAEGAEDDLPPLPSSGDSLADTRALHERMMALGARAARDGNHTAAQRFYRDASGLANTIARLEKTRAEDSDILRISRSEIEEAEERLRGIIEGILSRGDIRCVECSRKLSMLLGTGSTEGKQDGTPPGR